MKETGNNSKKARIELIFSMAVFGTIGIFVRGIPLPSGELALYRAVLASFLILAYFLCCRIRVGYTGIDISSLKREFAILLASGAAMGINWILLFEAYRYTTVSAATLSYYFAPVIVTILCPVLFHETLTKKQVLCFVMSTAGVVLIIGIHNLGGGGRDLIGILFGIGAAVFYASVILLNKFIKGVSGIQRTFLQFLAAIAVLIPYVACTGGFHLSGLSGAGWRNLLIVGLFHTGITYCLYFSSLKELRGQEAAILSYIDPVVAVVVSVLVLGERITWLQVAGGLLIIGFAVWNEISAENLEPTGTSSGKSTDPHFNTFQ